MRKAFLFFLMYISFGSNAQEIFCRVQVSASQIQTSDRKVFQTLQTAIHEFVNNTKWTSASVKNEERIDTLGLTYPCILLVCTLHSFVKTPICLACTDFIS